MLIFSVFRTRNPPSVNLGINKLVGYENDNSEIFICTSVRVIKTAVWNVVRIVRNDETDDWRRIWADESL